MKSNIPGLHNTYYVHTDSFTLSSIPMKELKKHRTCAGVSQSSESYVDSASTILNPSVAIDFYLLTQDMFILQMSV